MRFDSDVYRFIFAAKNFSEASERAFRESIGTFRKITAAEAAFQLPSVLGKELYSS